LFQDLPRPHTAVLIIIFVDMTTGVF